MADFVEYLLQGLTPALLAGVSTLAVRSPRLEVNTTLWDAASVGDRRRVKKLLAEGVDPNSADEDGTTALMAAVFAGHLEVVQDLLEAGAETDVQDVSGMTALMNGVIAAGELELGETHPIFSEIVQLLLDSGADLDLEDEDGSTALSYAQSLDLFDMVEVLRQ
jgi:ankyrin repeat protein